MYGDRGEIGERGTIGIKGITGNQGAPVSMNFDKEFYIVLTKCFRVFPDEKVNKVIKENQVMMDHSANKEE